MGLKMDFKVPEAESTRDRPEETLSAGSICCEFWMFSEQVKSWLQKTLAVIAALEYSLCNGMLGIELSLEIMHEFGETVLKHLPPTPGECRQCLQQCLLLSFRDVFSESSGGRSLFNSFHCTFNLLNPVVRASVSDVTKPVVKQ
ncbi:hypothetical protein STEG23_004191, partial [Scotinomys teguina]